MGEFFGRAYWPGVTGAKSCRYTVGHGPSHGVAVLVVGAQDVGLIQKVGDLTLTDGVNPPVVVKGCRVDAISAPGDGTYVLTIMDGRWHWRHGRIDGFYNQTDPVPDAAGLPRGEFRAAAGRPFVPGTERTAGELAVLCLRALKVPPEKYRADPGMPAAHPAVSWMHQNPAAALAQVCDEVGYRLVYQPNADRVLLARLGSGAAPAGLPLVSAAPAADPADPPRAAVACGGPTYYADYLPLQPVGREADGRIVPIDFLSYRPAGGWSRTQPGLYTRNQVTRGDCQTLTEAAELANEVWSLYRVWAADLQPVDLSDLLAGDAGAEGDRVRHGRRFALANRVYHAEKDATGQFKTSDPFVVGERVYERTFRAWFRVANVDGPEFIPVPFAVDGARGLVRFARPLYHYERVEGVPTFSRPDLWLYTSFHLRDADTHQFLGLAREKTYLAAGGALPEVVPLPHLRRVVRAVRELSGHDFDGNVPFTLTRVETNDADVREEADRAMDDSRRKYERADSGTYTYGGIHPVDPDGLTHQVTWSVSTDGPATTTVSTNTEHAHWLPPYEERRRRERLPWAWLHRAMMDKSPYLAADAFGEVFGP